MTQRAPARAGARIYVFAAFAVVLAAVFVRLGFWQLSRLAERRALNANLAARLTQPVVPFERLKDTSSFRRVTIDGVPDYENEIVYTGRSRNGSPGVYILTPLRRQGTDTAVLVIRGWVYAPDAATVDLARWREARTSYSGYVSALLSTQPRPSGAAKGRKVRALSISVRSLFPYPIAPQYVVARDSGANTPARLSMPTLDNGPHLSYAIQWFSFAAIAVIGAAVVMFRD